MSLGIIPSSYCSCDQIHCLRMLNLAFGLHPSVTKGHVGHCLGYLKLMALCSADTTLEPGDFVTRESGYWAPEARYTCANSDAIHQWMDNNYKGWVAFPNRTQ